MIHMLDMFTLSRGTTAIAFDTTMVIVGGEKTADGSVTDAVSPVGSSTDYPPMPATLATAVSHAMVIPVPNDYFDCISGTGDK